MKSIHCFLSQPQHDIFTWKTSWLVSVVTKSKDLFARVMITELNVQNWSLCKFDFFRSSQSETEIQTSLGLCDVMDYKIPLTQLLGPFRFIVLSPFLFECLHIHRPSQCSEAVLEQLSQITGSKIKQTWMDVHHTESYSFQMNLSLSAASSFTAAQWVKLWRICDWCTAAESHWVKVRP